MFTRKPARPRRRALHVAPVLALAALVLPGAGGARPGHAQAGGGPRPTIVLVHGDWADASSWSGEIARLEHMGFEVVAPPNPLRGPSVDVPYLAAYLATIQGPIVLVAHSYGGFVATDAATGNANVKALVYVDAFIPDEGDTLAGLTADSGSCVDGDAFDVVPVGGEADLYLRSDANSSYPGFADCFANGLDPEHAALLAAGQRPASSAQFGEPSGPPAWKAIPSWSLIGTADHVIPPALQERMSTRAGAHISTVGAGHLSLITRPAAVTSVILDAVAATT